MNIKQTNLKRKDIKGKRFRDTRYDGMIVYAVFMLLMTLLAAVTVCLGIAPWYVLLWLAIGCIPMCLAAFVCSPSMIVAEDRLYVFSLLNTIGYIMYSDIKSVDYDNGTMSLSKYTRKAPHMVIDCGGINAHVEVYCSRKAYCYFKEYLSDATPLSGDCEQSETSFSNPVWQGIVSDCQTGRIESAFPADVIVDYLEFADIELHIALKKGSLDYAYHIDDSEIYWQNTETGEEKVLPISAFSTPEQVYDYLIDSMK